MNIKKINKENKWLGMNIKLIMMIKLLKIKKN